MKAILNFLNKVIDVLGWVCILAMLSMVVTVFINVFVRYIVVGALKYLDLYLWYNDNLSWLGGVGMQELEWHFFSVMFLFGLAYTLRENGHVRVDVFYDNFSRKTQAWVNIIGALIFTLPFCVIVLFGDGIIGQYFDYDSGEAAIGYFISSWNSQETIGDPGSLPRLWPIKLVLPLSFLFLILSAIAVILKESMVISGTYSDEEEEK
ncbi:MAG: TRAP-type mannitol/chloroaromatic compound transport system permease small subunit [Cellvibrionaceae bacterium]|jgi:TRAP-type mannitol/chloroaromatic compound transport system permease small subunit